MSHHHDLCNKCWYLTCICNTLKKRGGDEMDTVRFGRVIIAKAHVVSVTRKNGSRNALSTEVTMVGGKVHTFNDHAQAVWDYFKSESDEGASGD
jgi:hypothetical protein